ncbi:alanine racemase [Roseinatronobacter sp. S2]|uniref:alanine racemase n=1 Tax=Roseinatronobacter sp. S2 TaxID=3035471 RepID=UPI00240EC32D|nr:alanine racemase [Roseinatronobacter sp. S2]WFE75383.1 alanine racemase [Roseinatronobacter sp. S2]
MMFAQIATPAVLVDLDIAQANIDRFQAHATRAGVAVRPHIKTHKLPMLAHAQIRAGAVGITCQKLSEARAMISQGGIADILITYNIVGNDKLSELRALAQKVRVRVTADSQDVVAGLSRAFADAPQPLDVLVECDTGAGRCGVLTPDAACALAQTIAQAPGLRFGGLMTYPPANAVHHVSDWLTQAAQRCEGAGLPVSVISTGGSPDMWAVQSLPWPTEYRAGTYVYNDRSLVARGVCDWGACALTVLATVVSVPAPDRAVIDAGSKVLSSDLLGLTGHGHVLGRPDISIAALSEEHGILHADTIALKVGDRVRIVPNHACVVANLLDRVHLLRAGVPQGETQVTARGQVW